MKRLLSFGLVFLASALLLLVTFWAVPNTKDYLLPERFTVERWQRGGIPTQEVDHPRWPMRYSLVRQHDPVGKPIGEVESLLGAASRNRSNVASYSLGPTGRGVNYGVLDLHLNDSGMVQRYEFREH